MSCLSKANLQITVGVGVPVFSGHPFKKSTYTNMPNQLAPGTMENLGPILQTLLLPDGGSESP